jgi:hypothetical protein
MGEKVDGFVLPRCLILSIFCRQGIFEGDFLWECVHI